MGAKYLIDTNAVIEFLDGRLPENGIDWLEELIDLNLHSMSVINKMELLGYNGTSSEMNIIKEFCKMTFIVNLSDVITDETILIRKSFKIKLPDAIIAATAKVFDLTIITRNEKDFIKIPDLKIINLHNL
jgi:predicted nucleic acid-binding protein